MFTLTQAYIGILHLVFIIPQYTHTLLAVGTHKHTFQSPQPAVSARLHLDYTSSINTPASFKAPVPQCIGQREKAALNVRTSCDPIRVH